MKFRQMFVAMLFCGSVLAQQSQSVTSAVEPSVVVAGSPGQYVIINDHDTQQVMGSYTITSIPSETRSTVEKGFRKLLERDGREGAVQVISQKKPGGGEEILLIVSATRSMQESIATVIDKINAGDIEFIGGFPANVRYRPKYRPAKAIAAAVEKELTTIGLVHVDEGANIVMIEDEPGIIIEFLLEVARDFDQPTPQVQVAIEVVEMKAGCGCDIGAKWEAFQDALPTNIGLTFGGERLPTGDIKGDLKFNTFGAVVEGISPQALTGFLNYLEAENVATVSTRATLNVVNVDPATFESGTTFHYRTLTKTAGSNKEWVEREVFDGVKISISGQLAQEGRSLNIDASVSSIVGWSPDGAPNISESSTKTTVKLSDQTRVLSGFKKFGKTESARGLPRAKKWDIFNLFHRKTGSQEEYEVFICVHVIPPDVDSKPWTRQEE